MVLKLQKQLLPGNLTGKCKKYCSSYKIIVGSSVPQNGFKDWICRYCVLSGLQRPGLNFWPSKILETQVFEIYSIKLQLTLLKHLRAPKSPRCSLAVVKLLLCQRSSGLDAPKGKDKVGLSLGWV